jgi:FkbM family methyltransferase
MCRWLLTNNVDEACTERLLPRVLREGDTVVDVGANLGSFTLMCARRVGPKGLVVSLEPGSRMSAALRRNLGLNGVADWVQVHQLAVCDEEGRRTLLLTTGGENTAVLAAPQNGAAPARAGAQYGEEVTVTRLDTIVSGVSRPIRLVKIDVEGAEWNVLRGATQLLEHDRPCLLIELSARQQAAFGYTPMELVRWLETRGYSFHWVGDLERPFEEDDLKRGAFIDVFAHPQGDAAWRR